ncbi:MAG TPA: hypothetical protein VNN08_11780 [Thermoanaerobaculia bacterium]|nr:hypothetical protein [Thermoanaerobaculia bacterium]
MPEQHLIPLDTTLYFNGIDASTGAYVTPPMTPRQVARLAMNEPLDAGDLEELRGRWQRIAESHFAPIMGVDPQDLSEAGWGAVFAPDIGDDVKEALQPLLALRKEQARDRYHDFSGDRAFRTTDSKNTFLSRSKAAPGPANPKNVPYYLLLVGSPQAIPFKVQYQLDVQYAVGRVHFDSAEEYANYANTVVAAEKGLIQRPHTVSLFGVRNRGDVATQLSADHLIVPLAESLRRIDETTWSTQCLLGQECTRAALVDLLRAEKAPALLISASHGIGVPNGDSRQYRHQGAILCQDWPGPLRHRGPIPEEFYVAADHVPSGTRLDGLVAFFFACYGGGTPAMDDFGHLTPGAQAQIAPRPFVAALPKALLGRPNGALAVIGHVERAWTYSFLWGQAGRQLDVFESMISSLLRRGRIGASMEWFNTRYAELSSDLTAAIGDRRAERVRPDTETLSEDLELAGIWTANNDARSYIVLGDPAVRLAVGS